MQDLVILGLVLAVDAVVEHQHDSKMCCKSQMDDGALVLHVVLWSLLCVSLEYLRRLVCLAVELFDDLGPDIDALAALEL